MAFGALVSGGVIALGLYGRPSLGAVAFGCLTVTPPDADRLLTELARAEEDRLVIWHLNCGIDLGKCGYAGTYLLGLLCHVDPLSSACSAPLVAGQRPLVMDTIVG